jgi:two-component system sensor histidine kinase CreC
VSLRSRIFLSFTLLITISFFYLVNWIIGDLKPRYREAIEETQVDLAVVLASFVSEQISTNEIDTALFRRAYDRASQARFSARIYNLTKSRIDFRVYIANQSGTVIYDSDGGRDEGKDYSQWRDVMLTLRGEYGARTTRIRPDDPTSTVLYVAAPIKARDGSIIGCLTVCKPTDNSNIFIESAGSKIFWGALAVCLSVILLAIFTASQISKPIRQLTAYARAVRDGQRPNLPNLGKSEIGELGLAFEQMRDALEGKKYVEKYVQTLTHEIKSPLSAIHGAAELMNEEMPLEARQKFLGNIRNEAGRIRGLIDKLLQLSTLESRNALQEIEIIDINELISGDVIPAFDAAFKAKNVRLVFEAGDKHTIRGERFLVRQALSNLLQNALDFAPGGSQVGISATEQSGFVSIAIQDEGPGIPEYARERVFERFYSLQRPDTGQKSSGLGLSLVREVAELHQGSCSIENRSNGGTRATLNIPVAETRHA